MIRNLLQRLVKGVQGMFIKEKIKVSDQMILVLKKEGDNDRVELQ